jgi:VIT1/CCC1 family predicted Fe2+/Mn2+ transporter
MRRVLTTSERTSEVLFGLIMVLTFTGSLSVAEAGREDVRTMLIGALGCNIAWGIIDAILYLMGSLAATGTNLRTYRAVRHATDPQEAAELIAGALPPLVASVLQPAELESLRERLLRLPEPPSSARLGASDLIGALGVFLLVFLSTFPVAIPFLFMTDAVAAKRTSDGIAIVMLFIAGVVYGRSIHGRAWLFGVGMVLLGAILVALAIALGG